jgi:hypothetical protein
MGNVIVAGLEALERFAAALRSSTGPLPWALVIGVPFPLLAAGAQGLIRWLVHAAVRGEPRGYGQALPRRAPGRWFPRRGGTAPGRSFSGVEVDPNEPARATVTAIVLGVLGVILGVLSTLPRGAAAAYLGYLALLLLVAAWAVVRFGINDPDIQWRQLAVVGWARWYGSFLLVALIVGTIGLQLT